MHDHSLGGPTSNGSYDGPVVDGKPLHEGNCSDSTYGCIRCWNASNDGQGEFFTCDWCKKQANTRITRASDEPVSYALCKECRLKNQRYVEEHDTYYSEQWDPYWGTQEDE